MVNGSNNNNTEDVAATHAQYYQQPQQQQQQQQQQHHRQAMASSSHEGGGGGERNANTVELYLPHYRLGRTLGIGSFGKVKLAEHVLTGHKVAIKVLNLKKVKALDMEEKVRREIKILRLFQHPHIIRSYEVIETPTDIYVVTEYVKSGELFDYIVEKGRLAEDEARRFFQQIISGVEYCHRNMVVHRDLKPENLLLDSKSNVKIADFGLSNIMRDGHFLKTSCGSPNYAAPEVISGKLYAGPEVDVWSCGVILYALLCGSLPFDDENIPNLFKKIKNGIYFLPSHLSPGSRDLIPRMLVVDPLKRITIPEIRQHPWFAMHLPRYLAVSPPETHTQSQVQVDPEILSNMVRLGFNEADVVESVSSGKGDRAFVAYNLMIDNSRRISSGYLGKELCEGMDDVELMQPESLIEPANSEFTRNAKVMSQRVCVTERRWTLGIHYKASPTELMSELLKVLRSHDIVWKRGPGGIYNLKCIKMVDSIEFSMIHDSKQQQQQRQQQQKIQIKFEIQVYRDKNNRYVLDIQRLQGHMYTFLDVVTAIFGDLQS